MYFYFFIKDIINRICAIKIKKFNLFCELTQNEIINIEEDIVCPLKYQLSCISLIPSLVQPSLLGN